MEREWSPSPRLTVVIRLWPPWRLRRAVLRRPLGAGVQGLPGVFAAFVWALNLARRLTGPPAVRKRFAWAFCISGPDVVFSRVALHLPSVRACFDVHRVTWRGVQVLLDPEIPLCGADLRMPVGERDLLNFRAVGVCESAEGAPEVVRRELGDPGVLGAAEHDLVGGGGAHARADVAVAVDAADDRACGDACGFDPVQNLDRASRWDRHCPVFAALAKEIGEHPAFLTFLDLFHLYGDGFIAPQSAFKQ